MKEFKTIDYLLVKRLLNECILYSKDEYLTIGAILKGINKEDNYKNLWIDWTIYGNDNGNDNDINYNDIWNSIDKKDIGILGIKRIAKIDNKQKYKEIINDNLIPFIDNCISYNESEYEISKFVYYMYKDKYKELSKKDTYLLNIKLSEKISKLFADRAVYYSQIMIETIDDGEKEFYHKKIASALKIALNLRKHNFKSKIMKEVKLMFKYLE